MWILSCISWKWTVFFVSELNNKTDAILVWSPGQFDFLLRLQKYINGTGALLVGYSAHLRNTTFSLLYLIIFILVDGTTE